MRCLIPGGHLGAPSQQWALTCILSQACKQPSDKGGGRFPQILDLFQGLKVGVPSGCLTETSIFKIRIHDVTLWSYLKSVASLLDFINSFIDGRYSWG